MRHGSDYANTDVVRQGFTKPEDAARFIEETGADALAIAFGSAHRGRQHEIVMTRAGIRRL